MRSEPKVGNVTSLVERLPEPGCPAGLLRTRSWHVARLPRSLWSLSLTVPVEAARRYFAGACPTSTASRARAADRAAPSAASCLRRLLEQDQPAYPNQGL